jgi:hypothetical protein
MDRPLKDHIACLEHRLLDLNEQIMQIRRTHDEMNRFQVEIRAAEMALTYYRKALELESQLSK